MKEMYKKKAITSALLGFPAFVVCSIIFMHPRNLDNFSSFLTIFILAFVVCSTILGCRVLTAWHPVFFGTLILKFFVAYLVGTIGCVIIPLVYFAKYKNCTA